MATNVSDTFIKEIFNEDNGKTSSGRVSSFISLLAAITWVSFFLYKTHTFPDFTGIIAFASASYTINKVTNVVGQLSGKVSQ